MYPHRIRLRGPWECESLAPEAKPRRVLLPCAEPDPGLAGALRFRRAFGYPGRIDDVERVWLVGEGFARRAQLALNGDFLGQIDQSTFAFDVTARLVERNALVVTLEAGPGLWEDIALEVRRTAFLGPVSVQAEEQRLRIRGLVVGTAKESLEVYVIQGRSNIAYGVVTASPQGQPFELLSELLADNEELRTPLRIELVGGAVVWYVREVSVSPS